MARKSASTRDVSKRVSRSPVKRRNQTPWGLAELDGRTYSADRLEIRFDVPFVARLAQREKQIQQSYRPVIGVHKWFARRPGSLFRSLLISEFARAGSLEDLYYTTQSLEAVTVLDPFMGGGTPLFEANRMGASVIGCDINPMAYWVVRQELTGIDIHAFEEAAAALAEEVESDLGWAYKTTCVLCGDQNADVKYFLWIKQQRCGDCGQDFDLSPGPLVATDDRHTAYVFHCLYCGRLTERASGSGKGFDCQHCHRTVEMQGTARRNQYRCSRCGHAGRYPAEEAVIGPPRHRLFAIEYRCARCKPTHAGRFFKASDPNDLQRFETARSRHAQSDGIAVPDEAIPDGVETKRLHRWGYLRFRELFNERQLLGLTTLATRIQEHTETQVRDALATVFSDFLRYQNMLCRYDTMALKCQDIFSVHGFPVSLVQCENSLLGLPGIGSGGFRHFVLKYKRAKEYCKAPFETRLGADRSKRTVAIPEERIAARLIRRGQVARGRDAWLHCGSVTDLQLRPGTVDGVFTDPPYFDNVQYAELMEFCYIWLRRFLRGGHQEFVAATCHTERELTGNQRTSKGLEFFAQGLSDVYRAAARALKPGAPFVFTYHHNDLGAYAAVCVAMLDAHLVCTGVLPAPGEMEASLHISGTGSSRVDSVFVARKGVEPSPASGPVVRAMQRVLTEDAFQLAKGGIEVGRGDVNCIALGIATANATRKLAKEWDRRRSIVARLEAARRTINELMEGLDLDAVVQSARARHSELHRKPRQQSLFGAIPA